MTSRVLKLCVTSFQSTRPRGARPKSKLIAYFCVVSFNPRARVGRDVATSVRPPKASSFQSTRPRGARHEARGVRHQRICRFNPRARVGRDSTTSTATTQRRRFNPRARVGRDLCWRRIPLVPICFNPRARVGRDPHSPHTRIEPQAVSIHAPAWGATAHVALVARTLSSFNPRARVGRDAVDSLAGGTDVPCFNPRARVGRDYEKYL